MPPDTMTPLDDLQATMVMPQIPSGDPLSIDGVDPATEPKGTLPDVPRGTPPKRDDTEASEAIKAEVQEWWRRTAETDEHKRLVRQLKRDTATIFGEDLGSQSIDEQAETEDRAKVMTRHIYRNAVQSMALIMPNDPDVAIEPQKMLPKYDPQTWLPVDGDSDGIEPFDVVFAATLQLAQAKFAQECAAVQNLRGFFQDGHHYEIVWLVTTWQQNYRTDSLNGERLPDIQDQIAELEVLTEQYDTDEFDDQDPRYAAMNELLTSVAAQTEIPVWEGPVMKSHPSHMVGIDPKVKRIEDWRKAEWIYRDYLFTRMEVLKRFRKISPDTLIGAGVYDSNGVRMGNDARDNEGVAQQKPEGSSIGVGTGMSSESRRAVNDWDNLLVRVVECKRTQTVYTLVEGLDFYAAKVQPENRHEDWYEIEPFMFNRPPGNVRLAGLSDTELQAKEQDRLNRIDTDEDNDCRAARPRGVFDKGAMPDWDKDKFDALNAHEYMGIDFQGKDIRSAFLPIPGQDLKPEIHITRRQTAESNMRKMSGIPEQLTGGQGDPKFAEQIKVSDKGANILMQLRANIANEFLNATWRKFIHLIVVNASLQLMTQLLGPNVVPIWSQKPTDRLDILRRLNIKVNASIAGKPGVGDTIKGLELMQQADAAPPGTMDREKFLEAIAKTIELPMDTDSIIHPQANDLALRLTQAVGKNPQSIDPGVLQQLARVLMPIIQQDIAAAAAQANAQAAGGAGPGAGGPPAPGAPPAGPNAGASPGQPSPPPGPAAPAPAPMPSL